MAAASNVWKGLVNDFVTFGYDGILRHVWIYGHPILAIRIVGVFKMKLGLDNG